MSIIYDGFISKHLNRKISEPIARVLAHTPLTPNMATIGSFSIAIISFVAFLTGQNILGGILAQISSIADGIDGGLARQKQMTSAFGSFFDALLDRYSDSLIILGITIWAAANETYAGVWLIGFAAVTGTLAVSYSRARVEPQYRAVFDRGLTSLASRDVRLFLIMIGSIAGQLFITLSLIALLTNMVVILRLFTVYRLYSTKTTFGNTLKALDKDTIKT